jgi:hypothetical protein
MHTLRSLLQKIIALDNGMLSEAYDSGKTHSLVTASVAAPHKNIKYIRTWTTHDVRYVSLMWSQHCGHLCLSG